MWINIKSRKHYIKTRIVFLLGHLYFTEYISVSPKENIIQDNCSHFYINTVILPNHPRDTTANYSHYPFIIITPDTKP